MENYYEYDFYRNTGKKLSFFSMLKVMGKMKNNPVKFLFWYRMAQRHQKNFILRIFINFMYVHYSKKYNFEIPIEAKIGKGLRLPHWADGIVIHKNVVIGDNCEIMQGVTIGNNIMKSRDKIATIGNRVIIGAGAKIIGDVNIGDDVFIRS